MSNAIPALVAFSTLRLWILLSSLRRNMAFFMALSRLSIGTEAPWGNFGANQEMAVVPWCNQPSYFYLSVLIAMVEAIRL